MTTRPAPVAPDWLVPGAKVVVCTRGTGTRRIDRGEVAKVTTHTFTVTGFTQRFSVKHQDHRAPGVLGARTWVVPQDSPEGHDLLATARREMLTSRARTACEKWICTQDTETRLAAIAALQAVEDEPTKGMQHG